MLTKEDVYDEMKKYEEYKIRSLAEVLQTVQCVRDQADFLDSVEFFDSIDAMGGNIYKSGWIGLVIQIPYKKNLFNDVCRYLESIGFVAKKDIVSPIIDQQTQKASLINKFNHEDFLLTHGITVSAESGRTGSECKLVQVGTKEVPVFAIDCEE